MLAGSRSADPRFLRDWGRWASGSLCCSVPELVLTKKGLAVFRPLHRGLRPAALVLVGALAATLLLGCSLLSPVQLDSNSPSVGPTQKPQPGAPPEAEKPYSYATKPLALLVGSQRGTTADIAARLLARPLEKAVGQPVVVVNRTEGGGEQAWTQLKQAKPDGYTLGLIVSPQLQALALDPERKPPFQMSDFVALAGQIRVPGAIFVRQSSPLRTVEELVRTARAEPDRVAVSVARGSLVDGLAAADFQRKTGLKLRVTSFPDATNALVAALSGQVDAEFGSFESVAASVRSGQGRLLAVMDEKRLQDQSQVPTLKELGIDVVSCSTLGYAAPKGTSPDIVSFLAWALYLATSDPKYEAQMRDAGLTPSFMSGQSYQRFLVAEAERIRELLPALR